MRACADEVWVLDFYKILLLSRSLLKTDDDDDDDDDDEDDDDGGGDGDDASNAKILWFPFNFFLHRSGHRRAQWHGLQNRPTLCQIQRKTACLPVRKGHGCLASESNLKIIEKLNNNNDQKILSSISHHVQASPVPQIVSFQELVRRPRKCTAFLRTASS